jgi:hypothetical protein
MSTRVVRGADGTALRSWCNDGTGIPVLLCNGLGAPPAAWPRIIALGITASGSPPGTSAAWAAPNARPTAAGCRSRTTRTTPAPYSTHTA